ncbi:DNA polymerase III subunit beta [Candidatus Sumerlaeota bacterium]|nr:DNA polymerase III subunit beta [Candidatus Sumerlaeota bacterium]
MHIQVAQKELETATRVVSGLIDRAAGALPVTANILIETNERGVQLRASDTESQVTVNLNGTVKKPGRTTVPGETFSQIVSLLPPTSEVRVEEHLDRVTVTCDSNEYKLMTSPAEDFPDLAGDPGETKFQMVQKTLKNMIDAVVYALPTRDHRKVLLGVFLELRDNKLRMTSTDGKKLARITVSIPEVEGRGNASLVVPRKLLENLSKNLTSEGPVEIELSARQIVARFGNVIYRCNAIEGKYPDCEAVIPKDFPYTIPLNRDQFTQATRRAGVVSDDRNKSIILKFDGNECKFTSTAHDVGSFNGRMSLDYTGPQIEIAFNYQFLIETLSHFDTPAVRMFVKSATAPAVFRGKEDEDRIALLMPIKLTEARPAPVIVGGNDGDEEEA